jgi:hypothetical protein
MDAYEAVSLPEPSSLVGQKCFSVPEANRALVLVRRIVTDIVSDYRRLCTLHEEYQELEARGNLLKAEETRQQYVQVTDRLSELRDELEELGCELKDYEAGLVDFPAMREDREVFLCWRLGEETVSHWHELDSGFRGRQRLDDQMH